MTKFTIQFFILCSVINFSVSEFDILNPPEPESKEEMDIRFLLHTPEHPNVDTDYRVSAYDLNSFRFSSFVPSSDFKFIVHGYYHDGNWQWVMDMVQGLLQNCNCNVIRVDWGRGSYPSFDLAFANTRVVGEEIAFFINTTISEFNVTASQFHCIGHSLGAYVCAFSGQGVENLGWITALDIVPKAHPNMTNDQKLDPSDAEFVDCIYTDTKVFGDPNPHGNINIYVNGGYDQPQCNNSLKNVSEISLEDIVDSGDIYNINIIEKFINIIFCDNFKSINYYNESIWNPSCEWKAYECSDYETFLQTDQCNSCGDNNTKCAFLGPRAIEYPDKSREYVKFFIKTEDQPPFCPQP